MSMKELLESKHPTAWVEFEEGLIDEVYLLEMICCFSFSCFLSLMNGILECRRIDLLSACQIIRFESDIITSGGGLKYANTSSKTKR